MEKEFAEARKEIRELYSQLLEMANLNQSLCIIPKEMYDDFIRKVANFEERSIYRGKAVKRHLKEKEELRRKVKELEKKIEKLQKEKKRK